MAVSHPLKELYTWCRYRRLCMGRALLGQVSMEGPAQEVRFGVIKGTGDFSSWCNPPGQTTIRTNNPLTSR